MCGYCTERIDIFTLWQHGRFAPPVEAEPNSAYSLSLECPSFSQLLAMQQNQQPLAADIVLIRLACNAMTQPLDSTAQQLCQAMLNQLALVDDSGKNRHRCSFQHIGQCLDEGVLFCAIAKD